MTRLLGGLGIVLVLGGVGHSLGVSHLYVTNGVPDANRVLLDLWIAEAQLLGGGLYVAASRKRRAGAAWRALSASGALTVIGLAVPTLPVLFFRAPLIFRVPLMMYLGLSVLILVRTGRSG